MKEFIRRMCPCPVWDMPKMESWLEDMARQGYEIFDVSKRLPMIRFRLGRKKNLRYRMEPAKKMVHPDELQQKLYKDLGWDYICWFHGFYIYSSADPDAPELHTDPQVRALTIQALKKHLYKHILFLTIYVVVLFVLQLYLGLVYSFIYLGSLFSICFITITVWEFFDLAFALRRTKELITALESGSPVPVKENWYRQARTYRVLLSALIIIVALGMTERCVMVLSDVLNVNPLECPLEQWDRPLPFPIASDLADAESVQNFLRMADPSVTPYASLVSPVNYECVDGYSTGSYDNVCMSIIRYHELWLPCLARELAREYLAQARDHYQLYDTPGQWKELDLGIDFAHVQYYGNRVVYGILCHGNTVVVYDELGCGDGMVWIQAMLPRLINDE